MVEGIDQSSLQLKTGPFAGGCVCGAVRYEATGQPQLQVLCHCKMCQRASGAAFTGVLFIDASNVTVTKGQTRAVPFSPRASRDICDRCAAPLFFRREARPEVRGIYVGSLDDPSSFKPSMHVCVSSAMPWLDIRDDAPRYDEKPDGMTQTLRYDPISGRTEVPG